MTGLGMLLESLDALEAPAEPAALGRLLESAALARADLARHVAFADEHYARNEVARGPWAEVVCMCWRPGQRTHIHDHRGSSCAFLVVEGEATEIRYELIGSGRIGGGRPSATLGAGAIAAARDADVHEVFNASREELITLHIYSPPQGRVHIYSRETGCAELWTPHVDRAAAVDHG